MLHYALLFVIVVMHVEAEKSGDLFEPPTANTWCKKDYGWSSHTLGVAKDKCIADSKCGGVYYNGCTKETALCRSPVSKISSGCGSVLYMRSARLQHDLFTTGYRNGGSQVRIDDQENRIMCLKACYVKKLNDDNTIDGVDYGVAGKAKRCYCNRGAKTLVISSNWITSYIVENAQSGATTPSPSPTPSPTTLSPSPSLPDKMCTGNFAEDNVDTASNKKQRPPPGTSCTSGCIMKSGRWGSSYCYTASDKSQWGAECIPCKAHPQCWDYYNKLTDKTRLTDGTIYGGECDENTWTVNQSVDWIRPSWYRVMIGSGRIASSPTKAHARCKTNYQGWMRGQHPKVEDGIVKRDACFKIYGDECYLHAHENEKIQVVNCGTYYLYYLPMAPTCNARYCVAA